MRAESVVPIIFALYAAAAAHSAFGCFSIWKTAEKESLLNGILYILCHAFEVKTEAKNLGLRSFLG